MNEKLTPIEHALVHAIEHPVHGVIDEIRISGTETLQELKAMEAKIIYEKVLMTICENGIRPRQEIQ